MSNLDPEEPYPSSQAEQLLAATLDQVRTALGPDLTAILLPGETALLGVRTELYQSPALRAGRDVMPDHYPASDRSLILLTLQNDRQVFLVGGRIDPTDPFDIDNALGGGTDSRGSIRIAYAYDGVQTITEHMQDGSTNRYSGQYGNPETLLSHIRHGLGERVAVESMGVGLSE